MKRSLLLLPIALAATACLAQVPDKWAKGRLIVRLDRGVTETALAADLKPHGAKAKRVGRSDLYILQLPPQASEVAVRAVLARNPHFKFVELDRETKPLMTTNDPMVGNEWHIPKIGAPAAWDKSTGSGVTIAIIDTGVDGSHPDLAANMVGGWNFYDGTSNAGPATPHGTWVAGSAAAVLNNSVGLSGVAGGAKIMPLRVTDPTGLGYYSMIISAITWAADHGARVANASFDHLMDSAAIMSAAQYMKDHNGLVVIAAGNTGTSLTFPPSTSVVSVSATDANDALATWSSYGSYVTISAPGNYIWTTSPGGTYAQGIGTSFSSPVVAGVVALMMAAKPSLSSYQIETMLYASALDLGTAGRDAKYGYGRVDAAAAVAMASTFVDNVSPTVAITAPLDGAYVSGTSAYVTTKSSDDGPSAGLSNQLFIDEVLVMSNTGPGLSYRWNLRHVARGAHLIKAVSKDGSGNSSTASVTVVR